jgi:hypothetical protein
VKPVRAGEELVGKGLGFQERDQVLELGRVLGTNVGGLTEEVLGVMDATNLAIDCLAAKARVDDDGADFETGGFQQQMTAIGQIHNDLHRGDVVGILLQIAEFCQREMIAEFDIFH